jgi:tetratricopeptide (TPR) repeat protein
MGGWSGQSVLKLRIRIEKGMRWYLKLFLIFTALQFAAAQDKTQTFENAKKLREESKFLESLAVFQSLLKNDSSNVEYLHNTAYLLCKTAVLKKEETERQKDFHTAEYLSRKAIALNNTSAEAHYTFSMALGRINENAPTKQKIANAKLIKTESETAVNLNPRLAGAWHILGRWHRTVAGFNAVEKLMINTMYGGVPAGGSYDEAIACFAKAVELEPKSLLHSYELAVTYHERGNKMDDVYAKVWLKKTIALPPLSEEDYQILKKSKELLKKVE